MKQKSKLLEKEQITLIPDYSDDEKKYLGILVDRIVTAKNMRDEPHEEFDNLTYVQYWLTNEKGANTTIEAKKDRADSIFQTGTLRTKLFAFLSSFLSLNLKADLTAYNEDEMILNSVGNALEDIMLKTEELELDEEKQMLRQYELLKQGTVFVEDVWEEPISIEKKIDKTKFGQITGVTWKTKTKTHPGEPKRHIIPGPGVYLGDMSKYDVEEQPFIFTVDIMPYSQAEALFGEFERWKYVSKTKKSFSGTLEESILNNAWRLISTRDEQVEVLRYQNKWHNEFQLILNGVPMLPMGYPLTAIRGDGTYTIAQQNLEPIRHNFAYGKSFIFKNKNLVAILDEMMKYSLLKTKQSFIPPYLNLSDRIISKNVFMPGTITRGIRKGDLQPISENLNAGVTPGEFRLTQEVKSFINENTVSPTFTGAKETGGRVTATQIIELQRQARMMMGMFVLAASLLEKKLAAKRLMLILQRWFDPIDEGLDRARNVLKAKYRKTAVRQNIPNEGEGVKMIIPTEDLPDTAYIRNLEDSLRHDTGIPTRMIFLNPVELKQARLTWTINVNAKEKKSSEMSKLLFGAEMTDAANLGLRLNLDYIEERFAQIWEEDPAKMFDRGQAMNPEQQGVKANPQTDRKQPVQANAMNPSPEQLNQQML